MYRENKHKLWIGLNGSQRRTAMDIDTHAGLSQTDLETKAGIPHAAVVTHAEMMRLRGCQGGERRAAREARGRRRTGGEARAHQHGHRYARAPARRDRAQ